LRCVYLSETSGVHDQRWCQALETLGYTVHRTLLPEPAPNTPIITGPLTAGTKELLSRDNPLIGLSWGFDLHDLLAAGNTDWLSKLDGLIVDSIPTRGIAIEAGLDPERIALIPWGIDLTLFTPLHPFESRSPDDGIRIVTLRAHEPIYRVDVVIEAVSILQKQGMSCSLVIGNSGTMTEELADQVSRLSLDNVEFIGRLSEDELPKLFSTMDIYVSAAETDGTSVTLLQAMAMQVPVVVSDSQGNVALLLSGADHPELGRLFELNSPAALARQVQETVQNPENTAVQVKAGRAYVLREADWAANIKRLGDLITAVSRA